MVRYYLSLFVISLLIVGLLGILFVSAVISNDTDSDGFSDTIEQYIGTNPNLACGANAWPSDFNNDGKATLADVLMFIPTFDSVDGQPKYNFRFDLNMDGKIDISDVLRMQLYFNKKCTDVVGCFNGVKDGSESYIDCGGTCAAKCNVGNTCNANSDCVSGTSCKNGVCSNPPQTCTDSDGGSNSLVRGTVTITASNGTTTYTDICSTGTSVYEYFCSGNAVSSGSVSCAAGYSCSNGACVAAPACTQSNYCVGSDLYVIYSNCSSSFVLSCANGCNNSTNYCNNTCTDSDGGNNIYVKGTASTGSSTATDFCYSTNSVTEYYCSSQTATALTSLTYVCPIGYSCVTGACVQGNISISQSFSMIPIALMPQFLQILITSPPFDFDNDAQKELITGIFTTSETIFHFREVSSPSSYSLYSPYSILVDKLYTEKGFLVAFYAADVGDSDGDGLKELITYGRNGENFSLRVYEQPSLNSFPTTLTYQYPTGFWPEGAKIDDLDKDGKKEIIFGGQGPNFMQNIQILENTGNNAYSHVFDVSVSSDSTPQCFNILDDVDNDGKKEVAFTTIKNYPGPSKLYLFESNGDNSLSLSWSYEPRDDKDDVLLNCAALIDLGDTDGDGKKEFLEGGRKVLPYLGYEAFSSVYLIFEASENNNFQKIAQIKNFNLTYVGDTTANAGDFDGDGKNEIVIANEGRCYGNNVRIYKSVSNNMFAEKWNKTWSTSCNYLQGLDDIGVGDLNGNGKVELIFNEGVYANIYEKP